ncbi:MAG: CsbD family protein [Xanthomonadaceae bacterium]|nr:CsbD family protein [Xanthomonadaceae bacterium]
MNTDIIKGKWKQLNGRIKQQWGELTDDDLTAAEGSRDYLAGKIQERYGIARDAAMEQVKDFEKRINH